jgi:GNAT superfamily N-acetyltransferase
VTTFRVDLQDWEAARTVAGPIRHTIFFEEKDPAPGVEPDELDAQCVHAIAFDDTEKAVGTGRLAPGGHVDRPVVLRDWRRLGVAAAILDALIGEARKRGYPDVTIDAPLQAAEFYRGQGFVAEGKVHKEGNALLQKMRKKLA